MRCNQQHNRVPSGSHPSPVQPSLYSYATLSPFQLRLYFFKRLVQFFR